jgi:hypothetical protein
MWWMGLLLVSLGVGCRAPDPDGKLRAGDLAGAAVAWEAVRHTPLDIDHPAAEALAARAPRDATITAERIADTMDAIRFLEQAPRKGTKAVDLTFPSFTDWFTALDSLAEPPALVVVGRSESIGDHDPYTQGGALPWKGGRVVGWAHTDLAALGRTIDADPPARLIVVGMRDATGVVYVNVERKDGEWAALAADDAFAAARLVLAAQSVRDYGGATLRERQGRGFLRR